MRDRVGEMECRTYTVFTTPRTGVQVFILMFSFHFFTSTEKKVYLFVPHVTVDQRKRR